MPPACAMAIAIRASVTVSIAEDSSGICIRTDLRDMGRGIGIGRQHRAGGRNEQNIVEGQRLANLHGVLHRAGGGSNHLAAPLFTKDGAAQAENRPYLGQDAGQNPCRQAATACLPPRAVIERRPMRVAIVENTRITQHGQVGVALHEAAATIDLYKPWEDQRLPWPGSYDALVVFGGEQNALDDDYPPLPAAAGRVDGKLGAGGLFGAGDLPRQPAARARARRDPQPRQRGGIRLVRGRTARRGPGSGRPATSVSRASSGTTTPMTCRRTACIWRARPSLRCNAIARDVPATACSSTSRRAAPSSPTGPGNSPSRWKPISPGWAAALPGLSGARRRGCRRPWPGHRSRLGGDDLSGPGLGPRLRLQPRRYAGQAGCRARASRIFQPIQRIDHQ